MVVRIRMTRLGRTHRPFYRIVAARSQAPRDGKFLEVLGTWDPLPNQMGVKSLRLHADRVRYWLGVGAQPSETVLRLLSKADIIPVYPRRTTPPKKSSEEPTTENSA